MTTARKQLLIECHPDRHGGNHGPMERFFASLKRNLKTARNRCQRCGVIVGAVSTYCRLCYRVPKLLAMVLVLLVAGCASPKPPVFKPVAKIATPPLPMTFAPLRAVAGPTLPPAPPRFLGCVWDAPANYNPLTESFEVWATTNLSQPFTLKTNTTQTFALFQMGTMEFYMVRTRNSEGDVSDWATTK